MQNKLLKFIINSQFTMDSSIILFIFLIIVIQSATSDLMKVFDDALPNEVLTELSKEVKKFLNYEASSSNGLMHGKKRTAFLPLTDDYKPRNYIELAILLLKKVHDQANIRTSNNKILGAEWWIQEVGEKSNIGFHYDKVSFHLCNYF